MYKPSELSSINSKELLELHDNLYTRVCKNLSISNKENINILLEVEHILSKREE